jgi:hypothetical protein
MTFCEPDPRIRLTGDDVAFGPAGKEMPLTSIHNPPADASAGKPRSHEELQLELLLS